MGEVNVEVPLYDTEVEDRVRQAILNVFPDAEVSVRKGEVNDTMTATARDCDTFSLMLRDQKIRDTARTVLLRSIRGHTIPFHLNKQAAFAGKVNFTEGDSVLGDMRVTFQSDEPEALVDALTHTEREVGE